ncbi:MAG: GNAT family N-acetyltransferase [Nitrospiraceae bacterium]
MSLLYSYRRLTAADEPVVWRMLYEAARMAEDGHVSCEATTRDPYLARYAQEWGQPGDTGVGAFDNATGLPVGAAWVRSLIGQDQGAGCLDGDKPELAVGVVPEHRRRGVGTELLHCVLESAREHFSDIILTVREGSPAIRLYERVGFRILSGHPVVNRVGGRSVKMLLRF